MKKSNLFILTLAFAALLASCNTTSSTSTFPVLSTPDDLLPTTPITDALQFKFADTYLTSDFAKPTAGVAYGKARLLSCTDGDTCNFITLDNTSVKVRFMGINTPESTAKVEPWGVKASKFTEKKLTAAVNICLVNDIDAYTKYDSSGGRNLGFVWYQETASDPWRCLNLELVEQCYSKNQLFTDSTLGYLDSFVKAGSFGEGGGYRVYGTKDPTYDYSNTVVEVTLFDIRNRYSDYGIDPVTGTSGKQLRVKALVVGQIGDNLVLRDLVRDLTQAETDPYICIYAYAGYNTSLASKVAVGDVVYFYCRATKYPKDSTNIQLSDLKTSTYGSQKFEVLAHMGDANWTDYVKGDNGINPFAMPSASVTSKDFLATFSGVFVETQITVRNIQSGDYDENGNYIPNGQETYYNQGASGCTIYGYIKGTTIICNLRIDSTAYPLLHYTDFAVTKSYNVKAYLVPYFTNYQLQLFNNIASADYVHILNA